MAIEKLKQIWFLVKRDELSALVERLAQAQSVHVVDLKEEPVPEPFVEGERPRAAAGADQARENVARLAQAIDILNGFRPPKRSFAENFVNLPTEMTRGEFNRAVAEIDVEQFHEEASRLGREHGLALKREEELQNRIARLRPWAEAPLPPAGLRRSGADLGVVLFKKAVELYDTAREVDALDVRPLMEADGQTLVTAVWLKTDQAGALDAFHRCGFESLGLEPGPGKVADVIQRRRTALTTVESKLIILRSQAAKLAEQRPAAQAALAYWETELDECTAVEKARSSRRIAVLSGYVRVRHLDELNELIACDFPSVSVVAADPRPDDNVPVSLGGSKFYAPAQFLTSMFGLPNYFGFDPSPYVLLTFLLFFGLCLGDVIYGIGLTGLGLWLAHKSGRNRSLVKFFKLLALGGVFSIAVGVLTDSWAGNLLSEKYLGKGNFLGQLSTLAIFDPLNKPVIALLIALGLGMANQFYAMIMLIYREWRKGRPIAGLLDGGLWLVFLPALVLLLASSMTELPPALKTASLWMLGLSAVGLVLTQGRHEKSFLGKAVVGVVSLYGIVGTYGTTSFIGDTLSYSRLLALGLTTVVVAQSINLIAWLVGGVPYVGVIILALALLVLHVGNFLLSILGGFVHSLRLVFVEFFTKFYEGGARPFAALGEPRTIRIVDDN